MCEFTSQTLITVDHALFEKRVDDGEYQRKALAEKIHLTPLDALGKEEESINN